MNVDEVLAELRPLGKDSYRKVLLRHGVREPVLGVSIADLKKIHKRVKTDHALAIALYDTGIYDAMYLAGLVADPDRMTEKDLRRWLDKATSSPLCGYTVPWVAAESPRGWDVALKWIDSARPREAAAGWATLAGIVSVRDDAELDLAALKKLLRRVEKSIHEQPDEVRYQMNSFVIAVGSYVGPLTELAIQTGERIGMVSVDMGDTACKVPSAPQYIREVQQRGTVGKKRKTVRC